MILTSSLSDLLHLIRHGGHRGRRLRDGEVVRVTNGPTDDDQRIGPIQMIRITPLKRGE